MNINNQKNSVNLAVKPLAFAVACALSGQVVAVEEQTVKKESKDKAGIERISVTAQKRISSLQETPIAITAFNEDALENLGIDDISDINNMAPNVQMVDTFGSAFNIGMNIRGLGSASPSLAIDPKVGLYIDGVYLARSSGALFSIVDLERMEILRGPQGTLWGKNTTGGAINMVTKNPSDEFEFQQKLSFGNNGLFNAITSVDTGEFNDFTAKITYMTGEQDGWAKNTYVAPAGAPATEKNLGSKETDALRIALRYATDDVSVSYNYDKTDGSAVAMPVQISDVRADIINPQIPAYHLGTGKLYAGNVFAMMAANEHDASRQEEFELDFQGRENLDISGHNLTVEWNYSDSHTFKSISSQRKYLSDLAGLDIDGGAYFGAELDPVTFQPTGNFGAIPGFHSKELKEQKQSSQEFQFLGEFMDGQLEYVAGYYYFTEEGESNNPWNFSAASASSNLVFGAPMSWGGFYNVQADAQALFGQVNYHISDELNVIVGVRHTKDEKALVQLAENDTMLANDLHAKKDWTKTVGSLIVNYVMSDDLTVYGKIAQGYASGVFNPGSVNRGIALDPNNPNPGQANFEASLTPVNPENTTAYEIGAKSMLMDDRIMLNAAIFFNDNKDLQVTEFVDSVQVSKNTGESETLGFEFDAKFAATEDLMFSATYGYRDTDYALENFTDISRFSASLGMDWTLAEFDFGNLSAHTNFVMSDDYQFQATNPNLVADAYNLLNARVTLSDIKIGDNSNLKVSLWGRNITDKEYVIHGADMSFYKTKSYGAPASYGLDVTFNF